MGSSLSGSLSSCSGSVHGSTIFAPEGALSIEERLEKRARLVEERLELEMFTLIVTGSSKQRNAEIVWNPLFWLIHKHEQMIVRHMPAAAGIDAHTSAWCQLPDQPWNREANSRFLVLEQVFDDAAAMVDSQASACFAFPQGRHRGQTWECMARAWAQGIPVYCFNSSLVGCYHQVSEAEGLDLAKRVLRWGA